MKAAIDKDWVGVGCLNHTLNLVVQDDLFSMPSIQEQISNCKIIASFCNSSILFYNNLMKNQDRYMPGKEKLTLVNDCPTRWSSTYHMLNRVVVLKDALLPTIADTENEKLKVNLDFPLIRKIANVLELFKEATTMLSCGDSSISQTLMVVKTIMTNLSDTKKDEKGVITFKKILLKAMEKRFRGYEQNSIYSVATFLDPRYRASFFTKEATLYHEETTLQTVLSLLEEKVYNELNNNDEEEEMNVSNNSSGNSSDLNIFQRTMKGIIKNKKLEQSDKSKILREEIKEVLENYAMGENSDNCFEFWKEKSSSGNKIWEILASCAETYLTPKATTTDVERLFSTAGDIITNERNRLNPATAEKILFLRENLPKLKFQW